LLGFVALAGWLGLETILGAFLAGVLIARLDRAGAATHPQFRAKVEGIGFGFVVRCSSSPVAWSSILRR
jgi:Kef-type K+ transport system membrane component KefB